MEIQELQDHNLIKESVINLLGEAKDTFVAHFGEDKEDNVKAFEELIEKTRNGRFSIIVVGEYSAGKSTFLNAIMREKYLDSYSDETTANINFLKSIKDSPTGKPMIRINYKDGRCETSDDVSFENITNYVSTRNEKLNGRNVATIIDNVEIFLDSPFLNNGVDLVDSPGLNGVKELHADITKNQMKASHAAIFMFRAVQPGTKTDFQALVELKKSCKSIIVVLNRIDEAGKKGEEAVDDIVNGLKKKFKEQFPNENIPEIWPMSAYKALVARSKMELDFHDKTTHTDEEKKLYLETSLIEPFESRLMRYITKGEKAKNELLSPVEKVISASEESIKDLEVEKETLNGKFSTDDINIQIDAVNAEIKAVKDTIAHKKNDVADAIYDAVRNAKNTIKSDTKDLKENTLRNLDNETELSDLESNVKLYVSRIMSKYHSVYSDALNMLETEFRNAIRRNVEGSINIINKQLSSICNDDTHLSEVIEIDTSHFNAEFDLSKYDSEIIAIQEERKTILEKQYRAEDDQLEAERIKAKIERIEAFIQSENEEFIIAKGGLHDPGVGTRKELKTRDILVKRRWINPKRWLGKKYDTDIQQYEAEVPDYTAHNFYLQQKEELEDEHRKKLGEYEDKRAQLEEKLSACISGSRDAQRFQFERENLEREISELQAERKEKLETVIKNQLTIAKKYVEEVFESLESDSRKQAINSITEKEELLSQLAMSILEGEIKEELEIKTKKLEALKSKMALAEKDKVERLQKIEDALAALNSLVDKAAAVRVTIDSIETDTIKEQ